MLSVMAQGQIPEQLEARYLPYAKHRIEAITSAIEKFEPGERYWRTADELTLERSDSAELPLAGLKLVLDPGHIGGQWAETEERHFRMAPEDFWVREGELVLEVAQRAQSKLEELGAVVALTRNDFETINPKPPQAYLETAMRQVPAPDVFDIEGLYQYYTKVSHRSKRLAVVTGDIAARARLINESLQPDAVISIHINAAAWPNAMKQELAESNHLHVLIFGCLSETELDAPGQLEAMMEKVMNGSGAMEALLGQAMASRLMEATQLPAAEYSDTNAVLVEESGGYLWARNLMLLRLVKCPIVLLEPYVANGLVVYSRIQAALAARAVGQLAEDDILVEYADAIVAGVAQAYSPQSESDLTGVE